MTFRHSLRSRIIFAFCLFGCVLGSVFALIVYISLDYIDDSLIDNRLEQEIEHISRHYQQNGEIATPVSPHIKAYRGTASMAAPFKEMVAGFSEGFHEAYLGKEEYHIAVITLPNLDNPVYLIFEVSALEFTEKRKFRISMVLVAGVIMVVGLGLWIGWMTSSKVIAPVIHLAEKVDKGGPDNLPTDLSRHFYDDEVGVLARALEQSMQRVETFVDREQRFTRNASHELRTPVAVIKGAVELLKKNLDKPAAAVLRPLNRIDRSVANMENIIEALLWLSREEAPISPQASFVVLPVVRDIIEQNQKLIAGKPVDINLVARADPVLKVSSPLFQIALANLIRNSVDHTTKGTITVYVHDDRVVISDTGEGIAQNNLNAVMQPHVSGSGSKGFGLGLTIVKRLCDRLNWQFHIQSEINAGTTAELIFNSYKNNFTIPSPND
jgi:signal transduction histidine kinase